MRLHLLEDRLAAPTAEGGLAGKQLVERAAQAVDVRAHVHHGLFRNLLGGHVVDGAQGLPGCRQLFARRMGQVRPRQPQVEDLHLAGGGQHQVRRLDVAMDQFVLVGALEPQRRLADDFASVGYPQWAASPHHLVQVQAVEQFHDEEAGPGDFAGVVGMDDIGMLHRPDGLHFPLEAGDGLCILKPSLGQYLDRHMAIQFGVQGLVNRAHAPRAKLFQELVFAELRQIDRGG